MDQPEQSTRRARTLAGVTSTEQIERRRYWITPAGLAALARAEATDPDLRAAPGGPRLVRPVGPS